MLRSALTVKKKLTSVRSAAAAIRVSHHARGIAAPAHQPPRNRRKHRQSNQKMYRHLRSGLHARRHKSRQRDGCRRAPQRQASRTASLAGAFRPICEARAILPSCFS